MKPNDILTMDDHLWIVSCIALGALGQESLVGLHPHSHGDGTAYGKDVPEMMVPEVLLRAAISHGLVTLHPDRRNIETVQVSQ